MLAEAIQHLGRPRSNGQGQTALGRPNTRLEKLGRQANRQVDSPSGLRDCKKSSRYPSPSGTGGIPTSAQKSEAGAPLFHEPPQAPFLARRRYPTIWDEARPLPSFTGDELGLLPLTGSGPRPILGPAAGVGARKDGERNLSVRLDTSTPGHQKRKYSERLTPARGWQKAVKFH